MTDHNYPNSDPQEGFASEGAPGSEPGGSPIPPNQPFYTAPQAPQPQRVRRVGTLTMGLALILTGVVTLFYLFNPAFDIITFAKLAPAVLIFLGIEILISNFFFRGDKLKYDFLSTFVCFMLITVSVSVITLPPLYEQYGPHRFQTESRLKEDVEVLCFEQMRDIPEIVSVNVGLNLTGPIDRSQTLTIKDLTPADYVNLGFALSDGAKSKAEFAATCQTVLARLATLGLPTDSINFYSGNHSDYETRYELDVDNIFQQNLSGEKLENLVREYLPEPIDEQDGLHVSLDAEEVLPEEVLPEAADSMLPENVITDSIPAQVPQVPQAPQAPQSPQVPQAPQAPQV